MAAAVRRRSARFLARVNLPTTVILPVSVVLAVAGCSSAGTEPPPLFAGSSTEPSTTAPVTLGGGEAAEGGGVRADEVAELPGLSYAGDIATGLTLPWSVVVLPDGDLMVSDRETGEITRIGSDGSAVVGSISEAAAAEGEGGLLGLALPVTEGGAEPDALYAYYTSGEDNRVVRLAWTDGDPGELGEPEPILTGIPKARIHNGGRMAFGPDGHLYVGTGDAGVQASAQDPASLGGKILRVAVDGEVPADNPTPDSPVYSLGHRNVQGLAWDSSGRLWSTEFGPEVDDELNLVEPGGNYGWPEVTGAPGDARFIDAQVVWPSTASSSPSGMAVVDDVAYIGGLRGQRLWQVPLDGGAAGRPVSHFDGRYGRLRDVTAAPDGSLLVVTNEPDGARLLRVERRVE